MYNNYIQRLFYGNTSFYKLCWLLVKHWGQCWTKMSLDGRWWCRQVKPTRCVHRGGWARGLFSLLSSGVTYLSILYMGVSVSELTRALYTISAMLGPHRVLLLLRSQHLSGGKLSLIFSCSLATPNSLLIPSHVHRWIILLHACNPFCWFHGIMKRPLPFFFKKIKSSSNPPVTWASAASDSE